ncbi:MAG: hydrogen gas-evolving membrane-bound hydrogenase subunit E [Halobacteriaceae archaeon]
MTPNETVVFALVFLPFLAAATVPLVFRALGERTAYYAAAVALACFALTVSQLGRHGAVGVPWIPAYGVTLRFYVDGLSLLVGLLASGVGVLVFTYSGAYMHAEPGKRKYYATLLAFMGSMLGVAFAADLVALFVFWELTSVSSFLLIGHYEETAPGRYAARKSMLVTVGGGLFMLVGFLLLHDATGTFALAGTPDALLTNPEATHAALVDAGLLWPVVALVGIGAAAKSAQWPLHIWLPNAMEAPTPVSAFLHSATMVKAGVYLVGRLRPLLVGEEWTLLFATLGLVTMTVAAILAVAATDIKELLAYSTASHLGLIVAGFGFANIYGAEAGAFHILNHALFKAALFLVAGIVAHEAGTRRIDELGGLRHELPVTAGITVVAALSMAGVPPFNGFYSKELLFEAAVHAAEHAGGAAWLFPVLAVVGSVFTFLYSVRFLMLFFGETPAELGHVHRPPTLMLAPPLLLAVLAAVVGAVPQLAVDTVIQSVFESASGSHKHMHVGLPTHVSPALVMSALAIGGGLVAYPFLDALIGAIRRGLAVGPLTPNWYYDRLVNGATATSAAVTPVVQNGLLRTYAAWALGAAAVGTLAAYAAASVTLPAGVAVNLTLPVLLVLGVGVVAAAAVSVAPSHVAGVLTLSILGFMIAIFYILASAPDLALTQLVVETLVLVLFLLVLDKLPSFYGEARRAVVARDAVLSVVVGATVTLTVLLATSAKPEGGVTTAGLVERATGPGGGGNVVNVILVDIRAFDTLGEISVVAMAALGIVTLVAMREQGETQ